MPKPTPTKLTEALLRQAGYHVEVVERRHAHNPYVTVDLMNFADLLAFAPPKDFVLVQATSGGSSGHHADRRTKVLSEPRARKWVEAGGRILIVSWRQPVRNKRKTDKWVPRIDNLTIQDFAAAAATD